MSFKPHKTHQSRLITPIKTPLTSSILRLFSSYGSVKTLAAEVCKRSGAELDVGHVALPLPADPEQAVDIVRVISCRFFKIFLIFFLRLKFDVRHSFFIPTQFSILALSAVQYS